MENDNSKLKTLNPKRYTLNTQRGFSFLEVLIIITIVSAIAVVVIGSFSGMRGKQTLVNSSEQIENVLSSARSKTLSSEGFSQYGVHLESGRMVLFKGTVFTEPNVDNVEYPVPGILEISTISLNGGGSDVVFQRLTGKTNQYGQIVVRLKEDISKTKIIDIKETGAISVE